MASSRPVVGVAVDWANNGNFTDTGDDVSTRVLSVRDTITVTEGRDQARAFSPATPGQAAFTLNNTSKDYSPDFSGSPLAGNVVSGRPVRIQATQDSTTYVLYRGYTDGFTVQPGRADRSVSVTCVDALSRFSGVTLSTPLLFSARTGAVISAILDGIGWTGGRDLDQGASIIRYWWEEGTDALSALGKVLGAEGPPALAYVDVNGGFVYRDRHHRLRNAASVTSQATFSNGGVAESATAATYSDPSTYDDGSRDIVNTIVLSLPELKPSPNNPSVVWEDAAQPLTVPLTEDPTILWKTTDNIQVPSGGTTTVQVTASGPFQDAQVPVAGTGFAQLSGTTTAALSRTSGQSTVITLTDGGGGSWIGSLILRARPVTPGRVYQVSAADSASVTAYGTRGLPSGADMSWCSAQDAAAVTSVILTQYKQRRPIVTIPVRNANPGRLTQMLARDISDRITITDSQTGMNADCFIEQIGYTMSEGGRVMETVFGCEKAPGSVTTPWTFGTSVFGTGVFGLLGPPVARRVLPSPVRPALKIAVHGVAVVEREVTQDGRGTAVSSLRVGQQLCTAIGLLIWRHGYS